MKILAISGLMLAAAASVVSAAPAKEEAGERVSYRAARAGTSAPPVADWVEVASPTPASHGRVFITVDGDRFGLLRIASKGRTMLHSVRVVYSDGKQRIVRVGRSLAGKRSTAIVELSGAPIDHIIISTNPRSWGSYTVQGAPVTGGVASR
jgi:hypothetical protein